MYRALTPLKVQTVPHVGKVVVWTRQSARRDRPSTHKLRVRQQTDKLRHKLRNHLTFSRIKIRALSLTPLRPRTRVKVPWIFYLLMGTIMRSPR